MEFHADKAFFKSDTVDPFTNLPIYVFDSNFLPNFTQTDFDKKTIDTLLVKAFKRIIRRIPQEQYALVCFTSGFKYFNSANNTWVTALKCFQLLPEDLKSNMVKAYMVHESWLVRSFSSIVTNVLHIKVFKNNNPQPNPHPTGTPSDQRLVYCKDLTELSKHVDITKLRIGLEVYLYDLQFAERLIIPYTIKTKSSDYQEYLDLINERVTSRLLTEGPKNELVLTKPGNPKKLSILIDAIDRGNYLDMSQWDIYVMGSLYLHTLRKTDEPLIPIDLIHLPISDDFDYTLTTFQRIIRNNDSLDLLSKIFEILINMAEHNDTTRHTSKSLSKAITPALSQEKVSIKTNDRLLVGQRYIKNLIENWDSIMRAISKEGSTQTSRTSMKKPVPPQPRKTASFASSSSSSAMPSKPKSGVKKKVQIQAPKTDGMGTDITDFDLEMPPPQPPRPQHHNSIRNVSGASILSVSSSDSTDSPCNSPSQDRTRAVKKSFSTDSLMDDLEKENNGKTDKVPAEEVDDARVLADVTAALNKLPKDATQKKRNSVLLKFADGYSSIEGQKKVTRLAKLYEERLKGIQIINEMEK